MKDRFSKGLLLAGALLASNGSHAQAIADTIYSGGPILTINDIKPTADAVAVADGRIIAVGTLEDIAAHRSGKTREFDLSGRAMLPGFVDSHGHVVFGGIQAMSANLLAPPDGAVTDITSLQSTLKAWAAANSETLDKLKMIVGFGYDNAQLAELRHPTRQDLDIVSKDIPVVIIHQSGHIGVANSKALELAGIDAASEAPAGGVIRRDANGEPNGVLEEYAFFSVFVPLLNGLGPDGLLAFARAGSDLWARFGYTTAQDGRSSAASVESLRRLGAEGGLPIDIVAYPDVLEDRDFIAARACKEFCVCESYDGSPARRDVWHARSTTTALTGSCWTG